MPKAPTGKKLQPTGDVPGIASPNPRGQRKNAKVQSSTSQGVQPNPKGKTPRKPSKPAVYILVVGATGSGKTTFINRVSGSQLAVSDGLRSCTRTIQMGKPFIANGKIVTLVDTPGLDDTTVTEAAVLMQIAGFVSVLREQKKNLVGIIFLHSISDVRVGGTSRRNFDLFRKLSGEESLKNIAIATTMWGDVPKNLGLSHEKELKSDAVFYKPILTKGGKMFRYDDTPKSAKTVISYLVKKHPVSLLVQRELEQKKTITDTTVGAALQRNLGASQQRLNKELQDLRRDLAESKDPTSKSELGETVREMEQKLAALGKGGQLVQTLTQAKEAATVQLRESDGLVDILPDDSHGAACCIVM